MAIPHSKPWITAADIAAVSAVLRSGMIGQGSRTRELEQLLAAWVGGHDGVGVGSGSAALVLALHALGIGRGDEVILPTYVCLSVLEAVLTVGATPALCDVGEDWVITVETASRRLTPRTKAVIVPHIYGIFADMPSFRRMGVAIIEDCAQAVDASGRRSIAADIAVFSFHPTKCLTAGEGGLAVAAAPDLAEKMRAIRDGTQAHDARRLFSPLSDLAAGLALSQLNRYDEALKHRAQLAGQYVDAIGSAAPRCLNRGALDKSMFFRFPLTLPGGVATYGPRFLEKGIHVRQGVDSLLHRTLGLPDADFPNATEFFETTVSLPIYPALTAEERAWCVEQTRTIVNPPH